MSEYRLIQGGQPVAFAGGPNDDARREIMHYALVYSQDGPVRIEHQHEGKWRVYDPLLECIADETFGGP